MSHAELSYEKRGRLAVIRLERPDALNALTMAMIGGIEAFARQADADPDVSPSASPARAGVSAPAWT